MRCGSILRAANPNSNELLEPLGARIRATPRRQSRAEARTPRRTTARRRTRSGAVNECRTDAKSA
jgi:hypothetical protein